MKIPKTISIPVPIQLLSTLALTCTLITFTVSSQLSWTPIYVDTTNQFDLWTVSEKGCKCPNQDVLNCACCVQPGGCQCSTNPNRCAQCGLENNCQRFCNVSISSRDIAAKSGLSWVQLKSPALQGPTSCWWRLQSDDGDGGGGASAVGQQQRIEVQIHRLIQVGSYDNHTQKCANGFVQFSDGDVISPSSQSIQLCAENSRFSPPVVMFADKGIATLLLRISSQTTRSQLLAYVSFSSTLDSVVGEANRGGRMKPHSVCDWIYDDCFHTAAGTAAAPECVLASPGYPGLAPPYRKCRYFLLTGNWTTSIRIRIHFHVLSFPKPKLCATHHIAIWRNISSTAITDFGQPWKTLCEESESVIDIESSGGAGAMLEFRSGSTAAPFIHNGFKAMVQFFHVAASVGKSGSQVQSGGRVVQMISATPTNAVAATASSTIFAAMTTWSSTSTTTTTTIPTPGPHTRRVHVEAVVNPLDHVIVDTQQQRPRPRLPFEETPMGNPRSKSTSRGNSIDSNNHHNEDVFPITCGHIFEGDLTRGAVFRLLIPKDLPVQQQLPRGDRMSFGNYYYQNRRQHQPLNSGMAAHGPFKCQVEFRGRPADIVQLAAFNYKFRGGNCSTVMEVYDVPSERQGAGGAAAGVSGDRLLGKLCGPSSSEASDGQMQEPPRRSPPNRFTSSHSRLAIVALLFPQDETETSIGNEFLEGAFRFHDESVEGTVKPMSSCEVVYYGVTSSAIGSIAGPPDSPLLRLSSYPLVCGHSFLPAAANNNQTVTLTLNHAGHESAAVAPPNSPNYCYTVCGSSGCSCETGRKTAAAATPGGALTSIDHLLLLSGVTTTPIACLCGYFKDILPLSFESHVPLTLVYHATKVGREFSYSVGFHFQNKVTCNNFTIHPPSSSKRWKEILGVSHQQSNNRINGNPANLVHYTYFQCTWSVSIPPRFKLVLNFIAEENEDDCRTWNLTVLAGNNLALEPTPADLLFTFCPKQSRREFQIPNSLQSAFIKLTGVTLRPPQFELRWKYIDVMLGSGFLTERKPTNDNNEPAVNLNLNLMSTLLIVGFIIHIVMFSSPVTCFAELSS